MTGLQIAKLEANNDEAFLLHWRERTVVIMLMLVGFMTSFESTGVGPPLSVSYLGFVCCLG